MMRVMRLLRPLPFLLPLPTLLLAACGAGTVKDLGETGDTDGTSDTSDSGGTDSGGTDSGDSADSADTGTPTGDAVSDLAIRLHTTIPSITYASWTQRSATDEVWVEYTIDGSTWDATPHTAGTTGAHEQIVLGVPYATPLTWRLVVATGGAETRVDGPGITTGAAPANLPEVDLEVADPAGWDPDGRFLLTSVSEEEPLVSQEPRFWVVMLDRQGRYVWAIPADPASWTIFPKPSRDGTSILYDDSLFWTAWDGGAESVVHQVAIDGTELRRWETPGLSHAFDDLSDDTIVWFETGRGNEILMESVGEADPVVLWSCSDWVRTSDIARHPENPNAEVCGTNGLAWNEDDDTFTVSLWSHETVVEVGHDGEVLWYADPNGRHGYSVQPSGTVWSWQHEAHLVDGDRLLLSSGVGATRDGSFEATATYEFQLDRDAGTLELVFSYESDWVARYKGAAHLTPNGNFVHSYGSAGGVREITPDGELVWAARFLRPDQTWSGRAWWLPDLYPFAR